MAVERDRDSKLQEQSASLSRFYRIILGWDYFRLLKESNQRDTKKNGKDGAPPGIKQVKYTYSSVEDYISTFEPLLFEEVKAQIVQRSDDDDENSVIEWKHGVVVKCTESDGFHLPEITYGSPHKDTSIAQNDLLLLTREKFQEGNKLPTTFAFALVEHRQVRDMGGSDMSNDDRCLIVLRLRMYLAGEVMHLDGDKLKSSPRLLRMRSLISEVEKSVYILKLCSLSTISREYLAVRSVSSLPFKELILAASEKNQSSQNQAWKISKPLMEYIKSNLNESQQQAIHVGLSRKSFVLIQGPPGTGKTQTILGILSAILHAIPTRIDSKGKSHGTKRGLELPIEEKYIQWGQASPWLSGVNPRDEIMPIDGDDGFFPTTGNELRPEVVNSTRKYRVRVLVCAPSNSALDEIVLRVLNAGIRDEDDRAYNPKIVRIGLKAHHSIQAVSMDHLVEQKLNQVAAGTDSDSIRAAILDEAVIVFSTLSFSGSTIFSKLNHGFDVVIIDEAAQAVEPATLVPLSSGCKQAFLVGDPVQLPATVISTVANKFGYGMSLFQRFQKAGYPVLMLREQYRMHPQIRSFPSREFYNNELEDGPDISTQTERAWHVCQCFGPFCFFDIHEGKESQPSGSGSRVNIDEVDFVMHMYLKLVARYPVLKSSSRLAIVSPYNYQVKLFKERFKEIFKQESNKIVDIITVDGCQGREKDVVIFSCVRASKGKSIGFVADYRRMNVAITRARSSVLVVGSASTLKNDEHWSNLVVAAEKGGSLFKVSKPYASFFSDENLETMRIKKERKGAERGPREDDNVELAAYGGNVAAEDAEPVPADDHDDGYAYGDMDEADGGDD
ncbi:probable helicase MAGATAMA 3 [Punica granatum]|uniref:Uncharacterized protein n=2 Tax=Punica granatum TaxID=22663 RepID=A0A2I0J213_PUNGR|nr:probable helicase MAGATAMA 3 [Punica granatum]PKI50261.1 hypothetical protein CRG98_029334 [Punica granatum]